jgi:hypothetical protein
LCKKSHHGGPALHPFLAYLTSPLPEGVQLFLQGGVVLGEEVYLPPEGRVGRNQVFFKKTSPVFFCFVFLFFLYICPEERDFRVFTVSKILLGVSRL